MALTYVALATTTVGSGGAANIEFTSIPNTYTDLLIKISSRSTENSGGDVTDILRLRFNSNATNYSVRNLEGDGSGAYSYDWGIGSTYGAIGDTVATPSTANTFGNTEVYIPNYAGSNNKSFSSDSVGENNAATARVSFAATLWSNTSAITTITLTLAGGNFVQYSTATLYGIKNTV